MALPQPERLCTRLSAGEEGTKEDSCLAPGLQALQPGLTPFGFPLTAAGFRSMASGGDSVAGCAGGCHGEPAISRGRWKEVSIRSDRDRCMRLGPRHVPVADHRKIEEVKQNTTLHKETLFWGAQFT